GVEAQRVLRIEVDRQDVVAARVPVQASADAATAANSERRCRSGTEGGSVGFEPVIVGSVSGARVVT
ncbi:hypothetical protein, partial [Variovorax paradoxus]|uniref:hypothetical protein n=1 Tax=Variovorax paradoxus TaxID=34073 RepID=UPI000AEB3137